VEKLDRKAPLDGAAPSLIASNARQSVFGGFWALSVNFVVLPLFMRIRARSLIATLPAGKDSTVDWCRRTQPGIAVPGLPIAPVARIPHDVGASRRQGVTLIALKPNSQLQPAAASAGKPLEISNQATRAWTRI
jgi:hypothetical protein